MTNAEGQTSYCAKKQGEEIKMQRETFVTSQVFSVFSSGNKERQDRGDPGILFLQSSAGTAANHKQSIRPELSGMTF